MGLFKWRNRLLLDLPMRSADHDPVNGWSVNRGRAGSTLDAVIPAAPETPTKLSHRRGYSFDGGDYLEPSSAGYQVTTGVISILVMATTAPSGILDYIFDWETVGGDFECILLHSAGNIMQFYCGGLLGANAAGAAVANYAIGPNRPGTFVGVHDGTDTLLYINGELAGTAATPLPPDGASDPIRIGERTSGTNTFTGEIYHVGMADFALSPSQVEQYHMEQMRKFHQI